MAAVTVNTRKFSVMGDMRVVNADVSIASSGDTFVTGLTRIIAASADGGSAAVTNITKSGGTITFTTGGAVTNAFVTAMGF